MRIVHVITKCDYGGAQTVVRELALEQQRRGHQVSVITGQLGPVATELSSAGVPVAVETHLIHAISPRLDRLAVRGLSATLRTLDPDLVHTHSSKGGLVGRLVASRLDVAAVYTAHGWPFQRGAPISQRIMSFAGEWAAARTDAHVVCVASSERQLAQRLRIVPERRLHLVANGIGHRDESPRSPAAKSTGLELVMVARLSSPKRQDLLIDALGDLPDVSVTFVGDGSNRDRLVDRARPIADRVRFVGYADSDPYLASSHAAVLLSDYEGLPLSVIEAMRQGLPVITNRLPGLVDAIEHGRNGLTCELSATSVAAAIEMLRDDGLRTGLGAAASDHWRARFTAESMADGYERVYESARSGRSPS